MQFVLPFTKSRPQSGNLPIENDGEMFETENFSIDGYENDSRATGLEEQPFDHPETDLVDSDLQTSSCTSSRSSTKRKAPPKTPVDEMEHAVVKYFSQRSAPQPENPDLDFFKSILPDVGALDASEKRKFKLKVPQESYDKLQKKNTSAVSSASTSVSNDRQTRQSVISACNDLSTNTSTKASTSV
ncbi:uncharacterized protein LOC132708552 [Cylas formicarius]|uniref:uncharacterized protein LOC132708552 n=1 Tax=Cylas formicarius TaxID=197179 RepID=UPI00295843BF|nr:uncharacterized protein LOC132708552 [Cylas formicarius]